MKKGLRREILFKMTILIGLIYDGPYLINDVLERVIRTVCTLCVYNV